MTDNRARSAGAGVQLGARARSILETLARATPGKPGQPAETSAPPAPARPKHAEAQAPRTELVAVPDQKIQDPQSNRVVPLPRRNVPGRRPPSKPDVAIAIPAARAPAGKVRKSYTGLSAWLAIALPTVLAAVYFCFIAAPQFVAEARFAVRGPDDSAGMSGDMLGALTGMGGATSAIASDSYIVSQYIQSTQLVDSLQKSLDLRTIYTNDKADFLSKYRPYDFNDTVEHLTTYWKSVSWVYYEPISGIITFTVRAFTPEDALKISRQTIRESEKLVNRLSERAREDSISLSRQEQSRAELRLKFARKAVQDYRDETRTTDPGAMAQARLTIIADLEGKLAAQEAQLAATRSFLSKEAPTVRVMQNGVDALRSRIDAEKAKVGTTDQKATDRKDLISTSMAEFETLQTEREFAEKQYASSSQAAESARIRAERQSRYLATFIDPQLPGGSTYPARLQMILMVLVCSALAWAIGVLVFYGIRDHSA